MKTSLGWITLLAGAVALGASVHAGTPSVSPQAAQRVSARGTAIAAGLQLGRAGRVAEAEDALVASVPAAAGSPAAAFQGASALIQAALAMKAEGRVEQSTALAQRAMARLGQLEQRLAPSDPLAAAVKQAAGLICERLTGSTAQAKAYYGAAVALDPRSSAVESLRRLEYSDQAVAARQAAPSQRRP